MSTEMRYKPCFNKYNGINRSHKLHNRNIKRRHSFLLNVLGEIEQYVVDYVRSELFSYHPFVKNWSQNVVVIILYIVRSVAVHYVCRGEELESSCLCHEILLVCIDGS